jgi:CheY-like chemotaxis protein
LPRDGTTPYVRGSKRASKSIVVVDDSEDLAAALAVLLELEGYIVRVALTGAAGMDLVVSSGAQAVLLDYELPDMTGADVAMALRGDPRTRKVHIIMCTGTAEATVRQRFTDYHAFLGKPVAPTDLMRSLDLAFAPHH